MLWDCIFSIFSSILAVLAGLRFMQMMQHYGDRGNMYLTWLRRSGKQEALNCLFGALAAFFLRTSWVFFYESHPVLLYGGDIVYWLMLCSFARNSRKQETKKKLIFNGRANRLLLILFILCFVFHEYFFLQASNTSISGTLISTCVRFLPGMLLPFFVLFAHILALPIEKMFEKYKGDMQ